MRRIPSNFASVTVVGLLAVAASAQSVQLVPVADNTIYSESDALSNGSGSYLFAGRTNQNPAAVRRGLIKFDIGAAIPSGSMISSVQLRLYMSRSKPGTDPVSLHRLLSDWGEGASDASSEEGGGAPAQLNDATWRYRFYNPASPASSPAWAVIGGDYILAPSATISVGTENQYYTWGSSAAMVADVQAWLNAPGANFGWIAIGNEASNRTAARFDSRSFADPTYRPRLTVTYTPPANSGACCLPAGGCQILTSSGCTSQSGTYQGNGSSCSPSPCAPPSGACCAANATCQTLSAAQCATQGGVYRGDGVACSAGLCPLVLARFVDALPIPSVMQPASGTPGGQAQYVVPITEFNQQLHRDLPPTRCWGYGGSFPGATIEAGRDLPIEVTWINNIRDPQGALRTSHYLPVDTCLHGPDIAGPTPRIVTHLHGGHVPQASDGYPWSTILPGQQSTVYYYPNHQPSGTLWYHDHAMGITRLNVYMGLAGFYLIRDAFEQSLNLPSGANEIPLAIQDRTFRPDGTLSYPALWEDHFFGDTILVNGKVWPYLNVRQGKYRFRLLDGCGSRTLTLSLSNGATFHQIGTDLGLLPAPVPLTQVTIGPGERADIVVDFAPYPGGTEVVLTNSAPAPFPGPPGAGVIPDVMKFIVTGSGGHTAALPVTLRPVPPIAEPSAAMARDFTLRTIPGPCNTGTTWAINDLEFDDITEFPRLDTVEVWSFINRSAAMHPMHMHLVQFQVLDRQPFEIVGGAVTPTGPRVAPPAGEAGWKDTARVNPFEILRVIARFEDYTGLYPYHCHILEHEDNEMMRQMSVTCYANCDASTTAPVLNVNDFACFLNSFAAGNPYANCDASTTPPALNVLDFACFLNRFAAGCP